MENINQQQQNFHQKKNQEQNLQTKVSVCKHCGASLDDDVAFCPECGEKIGGEERICPICKTSTTSEFCPNCGTRVIPVICPNCGKESYSDFCDECGTVLNTELQQFLEQPKQEIQQMSQEEAEQIKIEAEKSITPELQHFIKKIEEHKILLEEREYFNKREKRIIKVFGQNPFELIEQSPEEKAFMTKMYEGLKKTVVNRQKKIIDDKIKELFPDMEDDSKYEEEQKQKQEQLKLEIAVKRQEMEKRYKELLANVTNEVQQAQLAEQKRLEEERLRKESEEKERQRKEQEERERQERERQRELARLRAEQDAMDNAFLGEYICSFRNKTEYLKIKSKNGNSVSGVVYTDWNSKGYSTEKFTGEIYGDRIILRVYELVDNTYFYHVYKYLKFYGKITNDYSMEGYWTTENSSITCVTYYKY